MASEEIIALVQLSITTLVALIVVTHLSVVES
jgi:hypothetical protein